MARHTFFGMVKSVKLIRNTYFASGIKMSKMEVTKLEIHDLSVVNIDNSNGQAFFAGTGNSLKLYKYCGIGWLSCKQAEICVLLVWWPLA